MKEKIVKLRPTDANKDFRILYMSEKAGKDTDLGKTVYKDSIKNMITYVIKLTERCHLLQAKRGRSCMEIRNSAIEEEMNS